MAGEIFKGALRVLKPRLSGQNAKRPIDKVVMGTVKGDVHDIGKNIVVMTLETAGFQVLDLGVDVPPDAFVKDATSTGAKVVGLSVLMTTSFGSMKDTIDSLRNAGLRTVKVMVGGGPTDERVAKNVGADAYGRTAVDAATIARRWAM
jgi:5-methyltetrahydrofolate--homocysteine methyltransferase